MSMGSLFLACYRFFARHRAWLHALFLGSVVLFAFLATRIRLEEDVSRILPTDKAEGTALTLFRESKFADKVVIGLSLPDADTIPDPFRLIEAGTLFSEHLASRADTLIRSIQFRTDPETWQALSDIATSHPALFLEPRDYRRIDTMMTDSGMDRRLRTALQLLQRPAGMILKPVLEKDPSTIGLLVLEKFGGLQPADGFRVIDGCLFSQDERTLILFAVPAFPAGHTGANEQLVQALELTTSDLAGDYPDIQVHYTGAPVIAVSNAVRLRQDSVISLLITVLFLFGFLAFSFRSLKAPFLVLVPAVYGGLFSLAMISAGLGSISMLAVAAGCMVLGIAVNYSIHLYTHYRADGDVATAVTDLARPMTLGGFTTVGGFFCLLWADLPMLRELGLFAGLSLLGAAACTLVFLPHYLPDRGSVQGHSEKPESVAGMWTSWLRRLTRLWVILVPVVTVFLFFHAREVQFDPDMNRMNYMSPAVRQAEARLMHEIEGGLPAVYLLASDTSTDKALAIGERLAPRIDSLQRAGLIASHRSVDGWLLSDSLQQLRLEAWRTYWTPGRIDTFTHLLRTRGSAIGFAPEAFDRVDRMLGATPRTLQAQEESFIRSQPIGDYLSVESSRASIMTLLRVEPEKREQVYGAFRDLPGAYVVDKQWLTVRFMELIRKDFTRIALMTSLLVLVVLWLTYGRIELTLVAYIPMFLTWIWILGIMSLAGMTFNIVNIIISALIFGLGDDFSIYVMDALMEEYRTGRKMLQINRQAIRISAVATLVGLGCLMFAGHPSLRSVGLLSVLGIGCILLIAQVLIPVLFRWIITRRTSQGLIPLAFFPVIRSVFAFTYFVTGSLLLTVFGLVLVGLRPFGRRRGKAWLHAMISAYLGSLIRVMANVRKLTMDKSNAQLDRPAVLVSNHASFLDILLVVMQHPRIVLLTNNWVWRSPVFGYLVRMADYYPVAEGAEAALPRLHALVDEGYSVAVFPEGTRSRDGRIHRFHKGAFYLAERLDLDILPVVLHGSGYTMPKGDFLLKDGQLTVQFLPRIAPSDDRFGVGFGERSKAIRKLMAGTYDDLAARLETPSYFRQVILANYVYKGPVLEWYVRVKMRLEGNYDLYHAHLPRTGEILDAGCGYGFISYAMMLAGPGRRITGIDMDEEKIAVASHGFSRNERIRFETGDVATYPLASYDGILLLDVLHYVPAPLQRAVLERMVSALRPGGLLVIREADAGSSRHHRMTRLTEFLSTRLIRFNKKGESDLAFVSRLRLEEMMAVMGMRVQQAVTNPWTSNVVLIFGRASESEHGTPAV